MNRRGRRWIGWALGAVVLALIFIHIARSPEWRDFSWARLGALLLQVRLRLLIPAAGLAYLTYLIRAWRWQFFCEPLKRCRLGVLFNAQVLGFGSIYLVGRAGEIVRPAYIAKAEDLPFTSQLAVWVLERAYDSISLIVLLALALYFEPVGASAGRRLAIIHRMHEGAIAVFIVCAAAVACLVVYRLYSAKLIAWLDRALEAAPEKFRAPAHNFAESFASGLDVVQNVRDFAASVACTAVLWAVNVTVMWLAFRSVGGALANFSWWATGTVTFLACLGLAVQLPGVGGGYQVAILLALRDLYGVPAAGAASAAILTWFAVMAPCVALGLILVAAGGLSFKRIQTLVEEEESEIATPGP
ncbi:MAG: lysylphosphatidylglycerol synthase transmembrane domain-containing protein [Terriglobia bacterium]